MKRCKIGKKNYFYHKYSPSGMRFFVPLLIFLVFPVFITGQPVAYIPSSVLVGSQESVIVFTGGDVRNLKSVGTINIVYDYTNMQVGKHSSEEEYIKEKLKNFEGDEEKQKEFLQKWKDAHSEQYEPAFEKVLNKYLAKLNIVATNYTTSAPVTLKVKTIKMEPGFNVFVAKQHAYIYAECIFTDVENNVILRYLIEYAPGRSAGYSDFDTCSRIAESYGKAAKMLAKQIREDIREME
jgi:hypothetical protein